jgi:hypothetical protein
VRAVDYHRQSSRLVQPESNALSGSSEMVGQESAQLGVGPIGDLNGQPPSFPCAARSRLVSITRSQTDGLDSVQVGRVRVATARLS